MTTLFVVYDPACGLCSEIRIWLMHQPAYVPLRFVPSGSPEAQTRFPMLPGGGLAVISDSGEMWLDDRAWIVCLWALREYRRWSYRFSRPMLLPLAQQVFVLLSRNRSQLSNWLRLRSAKGAARTTKPVRNCFAPHSVLREFLKSDAELSERLKGVRVPTCQIQPR